MASPRTPNVLVLQGKNYVVEKLLGEGAFGKVYKVTENGRSGSVYALKKIEVQNNEAVNMVRKEIGILAKCRHDHIVRLCGLDTTKISRSTFVLILMEYCEGGNLNSRLARPSDSGTNLRWMKELADAMCYLHSNNIVHRDLKPENVLLAGNGCIKLGDFGLAREFAVLRQSHAMLSDESLVSYLNQVYMGTALGTPAWMAPEVFRGHYTESADIFALGTIMYAILTRACMSAGGKKYYGAFVSVSGQRIGLGMAMTRNTNIMVPLDGLSSLTRQVLRSMLDYNPKNRPSARKVLEKIDSSLYLDDFSSPIEQPGYPTHDIQPYRQSPFPQPRCSPMPDPLPQPPSPINNFIPPSPSLYRQIPTDNILPHRQNPFAQPHSPTPNFIPPHRQSPLQNNTPHYRQAGPSPRFGPPSPNHSNPRPMHRISPINARPSHRSPFLNSPTPGAPIRNVPSHTPRPAFIRSAVHIRMHTPTRMTGPRQFSPRYAPHRFR